MGLISTRRFVYKADDKAGPDSPHRFCSTGGAGRWSARRVRTPWRDGRYRGTITQKLYGGRLAPGPISFRVSRGRVRDIRYRRTAECYGPEHGRLRRPSTAPLYARTMTARIPGAHWLWPHRDYGSGQGVFDATVSRVRVRPFGSFGVRITVRRARATGRQGGHYEDGVNYCWIAGGRLTARRVTAR